MKELSPSVSQGKYWLTESRTELLVNNDGTRTCVFSLSIGDLESNYKNEQVTSALTSGRGKKLKGSENGK